MSTTPIDGVNGDLVIASGTASSITSDSGSIAASQALTTSARTEIVFIEDNVGDVQSLVQQVGSNREVVILDSTKDGLQQIAHTLEGRTGIDALHIISHGSAGSANLGALSLDSGSVGSHQAELATIGASLSAGGDILMYGCDVGSGSAGQQLVHQLAVATGADVAASNDLTGSASLGGDWNLEVSSGPVETATLAPASYEHVLMSGTNINFEGAFTAPSSHEVLYNVPVNNGATLDITSAGTYLVDGDGSGNHSVALRTGSTPAEISFTGGESFGVYSMQLGVAMTPQMAGVGDYAAVDVTVTGLDANGNSVGARSFVVSSLNANPGIQYTTFTFDGMTGVKSVKISFDAESNAAYVYMDNMVLTNVQSATPAAPAAPAAPANLNLDFNSDSGEKDGSVTNVTTPTIHGTAAAGSSVHLYDTDGTDLGSDIANADGNWTVTTNKALDEGAHTMLARVIDGSGNTSAPSGPLLVRIDTQAPEAPTPHLNPDSDTGISNIDHVTGDTTLTIEGSQKYDSDLIKLYEIVDGKPPAELKEFHAVDGQWSITTDELSQGVHHLVTQATDAAGNVGEFSEQLDVTIVTDAPTAYAVSATLEKDSGVSNTDMITKVDTQSISGTLSAAPADGERVQVSTDGGQNWNDATVDGTNWTLATTLQYGANELQVRVINAADYAGPVFTKEYVLDQDAPALWRITSDAYQLKAGETATIKFEFTEDPGSSFSLDNVQVSGGHLSQLTGGDGTYTAIFTPTPGQDVSTASISVADESYTDLAGNPGSGASLNTLIYDTLPPAAPSGLALADNSDNGVSDSDLLTSIANPTISGQAPNGTTIRVYDSNGAEIGAADVIGGSWKTTTTTLGDGEHHIFARSFDNVGNPSEVSTELKVTVDTTPPAVSKPILDIGSDSGVKGDGLTNVTIPVIHGTAEAGSLVTLHEGRMELGSDTADQNGNWTIIPTAPLGEGPHSLTADAVDAAGNVGVAPAPLDFSIDTIAPIGPMPRLDPDSDTGISNEDRITGDTTPTITGSATSGDKIKLFDVVDEDLVQVGETTAVDGQWSITTGELDGRTHHLIAQATDAAGNEGGLSDALDVTIVTDKPSTHAVGATLEKDSGVSNTDFITKVDTQSISGQLDTAPAQGERVQVSTDGGQNWTDATVDGTNWTLATSLQTGTHDLQVRVINAVDNTGDVYTQAYTLDQGAPSLTISSDAYQLKAGQTATITFQFSEDPGSSFSWDGEQGNVQVSGGTLSAITGGDGTYTATFTPTQGVDAGNASISVATESYTDLAGNPGSGAALNTLIYDTLPPAAPSGLALADNSDNGVSDLDLLTSIATPTISGHAPNGTTIRLYDTKGATIGIADVIDGSWKVKTPVLKDGLHVIAARAFDNAGNPSAFSTTLKVTVDTAPVAVSAPILDIGSDSGVKGDGLTNVTIPVIHGTAEVGSLVTLHEGRMELGSDTADQNGNWTIIPTAPLGEGPHSLTADAVDAAGNVGVAPAPLDFSIDITAPISPMPHLDADSDTGISNEDRITGDTTPTITGSATSGDKIKLFDVVGDGELVQVGETTAVDGQWSITTGELDGRTHHLVTRATDAAGNEGGLSDALDVTIVTDKPSTHAVGATLEKDTGASRTDFVTKVDTQSVSGTLNAAPLDGERVQVSADGQTWQDATVEGTNWTAVTTLQAGSHDLQVRVIDAVENTGEVYTQAYTLDRVAPSLSITSDVDHLKAGEKATITFTFSEDPGSSLDWNGQDGSFQVLGGTLSPLEGTGNVRTATFTPAEGVNGGGAGIFVPAGAYVDLAGNAGSQASFESLSFDTLAPAAPAAPQLLSDNGRFDDDLVTSIAKPTFNGSAEAGSTVTLVDTDTGTKLGEADAVDGVWALTLQDAFKDGVHHVAATVRDAAGNVSEQGESVAITVDTTAPALAITSDVSKLKIGQTATFTLTFSEDPGLGFSGESIFVSGTSGSFGELTGSGLTRTITFTPAAGVDAGSIKIGVEAGMFKDAAGNASAAAESPVVAIDTLAPKAPSAPGLAAASDTGTAGDGHTETTSPVIEGTALAGALVTLYDGEQKIGSATVDQNGKWSIASSNLSVGEHVLAATQSDAAGNVSAVSDSFALSIDQPPAQPVNLVDGMPVDSNPVVLDGGVIGTQIDVPVVTSGRAETSGASDVADIPLAIKGGGNVLLAQLPDGYGLSSSGANVSSANAIEFLISSIKAATPTHAAADQGHLTSNGSSFLAGLAASTSLLVQTVTPVSSKAGAMTLTGAIDDASQDVALVVDTSKLAAGSTIQLQHVDFAAIIGAGHVIAASGNTMLSGDAAAQHFTVDTNGNHAVFAGGGSDTLSYGLPAAAPATPVESAPASGGVHASTVAASGNTVLHGGQDSDTATFTGARADYNIEQHNGYLVVSDKAAPDAKALVVNVEQLQFSDVSVTVENNADMNVLSGMYQSMFGRQADMKGIEFFADANQAGVSMGSIALHMVGSAEYLGGGHDAMNGNAAHDVGLLYQALFNREADSEGLAFWTNQMSHGMSLEDVATNMVQSVEMVGHQRAAIDWDFIV